MTLLESLISFVILALVSVAAVAVTSQSIGDIAALEKRYYASLVADNELAQAQIRYPALVRPITGQSKLMGNKWYWVITPKKTKKNYVQQWTLQVFTDIEKQQPVVKRIVYVASP
ncbi:MAG: type II secretion system minor pseudopilin GspI [Gammaproteobacteria bacterium]|nr:type II secretion system minor pseudopilin GspI [Gammaproteobacteria bacterium]